MTSGGDSIASTLSSLLAAASLVAGAMLLVGALTRPADRASGVAHALMGVGMADMLAPWGGLLPTSTGAILFAVIAAWFAAAAIRHTGAVRGSAVHLAVAPAAMAVMYLRMSGPGPATGAPAGGSAHAGHGASMATDTGSPLLTVLMVALAGYFVWYAWTLAAPGGEPSTTGAVRATAATATAPATVLAERIAHITMCALMAVMFLGAV